MIASIVVTLLVSAPWPQLATIPFKLLPTRHIAIEAAINNHEPLLFLFDTGAPLNIIRSDTANQIGLNRKKTSLLDFFQANPQQVVAQTVTIGDITLNRLPFLLMDHPTVEVISKLIKDQPKPICGIIGFPFFARFATTIDYEARLLLVSPTRYEPGDYLTEMKNRLQAITQNPPQSPVIGLSGYWGFDVQKSDNQPGVVVRSIVPTAPADRAGIEIGDRILTADGRWTDSKTDLIYALSPILPGQDVIFTVKRRDKELTIRMAPIAGF